jgi:hypothetical protein
LERASFADAAESARVLHRFRPGANMQALFSAAAQQIRSFAKSELADLVSRAGFVQAEAKRLLCFLLQTREDLDVGIATLFSRSGQTLRDVPSARIDDSGRSRSLNDHVPGNF